MKLQKTAMLTTGSVASAILSFLPLACCVVPLAFAFLGAGTLAFAASLMPYRIYFVIASFLFLGIAFYFAYRPMKEVCADDACAKPTSRRLTRVMLWIATIFTLALLIFPYLVPYLPV